MPFFSRRRCRPWPFQLQQFRGAQATPGGSGAIQHSPIPSSGFEDPAAHVGAAAGKGIPAPRSPKIVNQSVLGLSVAFAPPADISLARRTRHRHVVGDTHFPDLIAVSPAARAPSWEHLGSGTILALRFTYADRPYARRVARGVPWAADIIRTSSVNPAKHRAAVGCFLPPFPRACTNRDSAYPSIPVGAGRSSSAPGAPFLTPT